MSNKKATTRGGGGRNVGERKRERKKERKKERKVFSCAQLTRREEPREGSFLAAFFAFLLCFIGNPLSFF